MKIKAHLAFMMLLQYTIWGAWYVTLSSYLGTTLKFDGTQIGLIYGSFALAAIISPVIVGALSDKLFSAQKVLGILHLIGAILLVAMSYQITYAWFYTFVFIYALCYMPTIALTNSIAMRHLKQPDKDFSNIRVFGTIGWIVAGWIVAYYKLELSASPILIASALSLVLGAFAFLLPKTPPESVPTTKGIKQWLGLDALSLLKNRSFAILIIASLLVSIPLSFYYSFTNLFLNDIGVDNAAGKMTLGQFSEIGFMLLLPFFFRYFGVKKVMIIAMFAWGLRYLFFAYGSVNSMSLLYLGIAIHGVCYDFFFVAGQVYVAQNAPKELKSSAQGLLTQATYGVGMFLGTWLSGFVVDHYTINESYNWQMIWIIPAAIAFGVMILFTFAFKNNKSIKNKMTKLKVLVVGCGNMGTSHARAYHQLNGFEIVGLVSRSAAGRERLSKELGGYPMFSDFNNALAESKPDVVSINTYPDTHAAYVRASLLADAHVFVEKPLATSIKEAESLAKLAKERNKKLVIGYILRVHPAWLKFVEVAQTLGKPLVMRMNLNQQSSGDQWHTHKQLMNSMSPIVDCGVHYVDIMCLMTKSKPISVSAIGARLSDEIPSNMYNYGQLQVRFEDGSVGWYESGWGPMMSETAFFVKDVVGPNGAVSITDEAKGESQDIEGHTKTGGLKLHHSKLDASGNFTKPDEYLSIADEPDHDELCLLEQKFLLTAIVEDIDLSSHINDAVSSLKIVLAADAAFRTGKTIEL